MKRVGLVLMVAAVLGTQGNAAAYNAEQLYELKTGTGHYDPTACTDSGASTASATVSGDNFVDIPDNTGNSTSEKEQFIWNLLKANGFTDEQTAGIMGNIDDESSFDPTIREAGGNSNTPAGMTGSHNAWGLFQWDGPADKVLLDQQAFNVTGDIAKIDVQVHIWYIEMQGKGQFSYLPNLLQQLRGVTGTGLAAVDQATTIVSTWEGGVPGTRISDAHTVYKQFANGGGGTGNGPTSASTTSASCCGASGSASTTATTTGSGVSGTFAALKGNDAISGTFILGFDVTKTSPGDVKSIFQKYKPAGIFILGVNVPNGNKSADTYGYNKAFFEELALAAGHPIIAASDEEGVFTRYAYPGIDFKSAGEMANTDSTKKIHDIGAAVGAQMAKYGLNTDLAPVLDVALNSTNTDATTPNRAFSDNANTVATDAGAFADGLNSSGIRPIYKHFPGLGSKPNANTDQTTVTTTLRSVDTQPYGTLLSPTNKYNAGVMMDNAKVLVPNGSNPPINLTPGNQVASTSPLAIDVAHKSYPSGLVTTDDLVAGGVGQPLPNAVAASLKAGADAPLFTYTGQGDLDSAISMAKNVNTSKALAALDKFVPKSTPTAATATAGGCSCNGGGSTSTVTLTSATDVTFYDSDAITPANANKFVPGNAGGIQFEATYSTNHGQNNLPTPIRIAVNSSKQVDINSAKSTDPNFASNALDMEPNAAAPSWAAEWVTARATVSPNGIYILYSDQNDWPAVKASVATLPPNLQSHVRYWVAVIGAAQVASGMWGTQYKQSVPGPFGPIDYDITTAAGWAELQASPPVGSGSAITTAACITSTSALSNGCGGGKYGALVSKNASFAGVDQGIDFVPAGSGGFDICAPASGTITLADPTGHHYMRTNGQALIMETLDAPPNAAQQNSQFIYYAEIITINPTLLTDFQNSLGKGVKVQKGAVLGHSDQSPGIEVGWGTDNKHGFLCGIGFPTSCGTSFNDWVQKQ